jgi:hypothetical protein
MTELDTPLFIPPEDEGFFLKQDLEEGVPTTQLLHSPPRKRSRNLFEKSEFMKIPQCQGSQIVRDEDYYLSDGSCIILVEDTLFNVRPLILSHNGTTVIDPTPRRYTGPCYRRIPLPSAPCSRCLKETNQLKASQMTTQSFSREILCPSFGTSCGRYMPCELDRLALAHLP